MAQTMGFLHNYGTISFTLYLGKIIVKLFSHACCYFSPKIIFTPSTEETHPKNNAFPYILIPHLRFSMISILCCHIYTTFLSGCGTFLPKILAVSTHSETICSVFFNASASVIPSAIHPGNSGTSTINLCSSSDQ